MAAEIMVPAPVSSSYCVPYAAQLVVERDRTSYGLAHFAVYDLHGQLLFKVTSKLLSFHTNGVLRDTSGNPIVFMKEKFMTKQHRWKAYRGDNKSNFLFTLNKKENLGSNTFYEVFLPNNHSQSSDFTVRGNLQQKVFTIFHGDLRIAEARGSVQDPSFATKEGRYGLTVDPAVDQAFVAALVFIMDEVSLYDFSGYHGLDGGMGF